MRVRKQKYAKKTLTFYQNYFGFKEPHRVLIDGTFCKAALDSKTNIKEQLAAYFEEDSEIFGTPCARQECELFGAILSGPLQVLRCFPEFECGHDPPISAVNCLLSLTRQRNKEKLILATQDPGLLEKARDRVGVPLLIFSHHSLHLEKPSVKTRRAAARELDKKLLPTDYQHTSLQALKRSVFGQSERKEFVAKKKKVKGRNPLSCKPRQSNTAGRSSGSTDGLKKSEKNAHCVKKRRRRYRMKVAPHIRGPLKAMVQEMRAAMTSGVTSPDGRYI